MTKAYAMAMTFCLCNYRDFKDLENLRRIAFCYHSVKYDFQGITFGIFGAVFNIGVDNELVPELKMLVARIGDFNQTAFTVCFDHPSREVISVNGRTAAVIGRIGAFGLTSGQHDCDTE